MIYQILLISSMIACSMTISLAATTSSITKSYDNIGCKQPGQL